MILSIFIFFIIMLIFYFVNKNIKPVYLIVNNITDEYIEKFINTGNIF
jgi:hypothetical protein